jgi:2-succinyl-5-enolpyruvyl-6-hydroxy-3-cyclohexene-1-carboxylate synthase
VHINVQIDEPLNGITDTELAQQRVVNILRHSERLCANDVAELRDKIASTDKVLIVAGFGAPNIELNSALTQLAKLPNVVIMTESLANLHDSRFIARIDTAIGGLSSWQLAQLTPGLVITFGGALVSRFVKHFLRNYRPKAHWHVGLTRNTIDCFKSLTLRIEAAPQTFFETISHIDVNNVVDSTYADDWHDIYTNACKRRDAYANKAPWSDIRAFAEIVKHIPADAALHLSNGTPVRYAQLFADTFNVYRSECNRGVSGIDGSTSTAIGCALSYENGPTVLITGDMSAQYDIGALAIRPIPSRFKIIVMCNGGGGIFRFIGSTSELQEREQLFGEPANLPILPIAEAYGFRTFSASNVDELTKLLPEFFKEQHKPTLLAITNLPQQCSADLLKKYFTI